MREIFLVFTESSHTPLNWGNHGGIAPTGVHRLIQTHYSALVHHADALAIAMETQPIEEWRKFCLF